LRIDGPRLRFHGSGLEREGELAGTRPDLLAECAGLALGVGDRHPDSGRYRQMARLCIDAGADQQQIPGWILVGRGRAARAAVVPNTSTRRR